MALGDVSNPTRFLKGQGIDDRGLALDIFGGEVITAFDAKTIMDGKQVTKNVSGGFRSHRFPKTWKATSEYHVPGTEMLGNSIDTGEIEITLDSVQVSHNEVADIDKMISHFDTRSPFSIAMGKELAKVYDANSMRQVILAARNLGDGPFPGGTIITDASLAPTSGVYNGNDWYDAIKAANKALFDKDVDEDAERNMFLPYDVFEAIKFAKDINGQYLILNRDFGHAGAGGIGARAETMMVDGVMLCKTKLAPTTDETANTAIYSKYRANYSTTLAALWIPEATATLKLLDIQFEYERDVRRQSDFMVAKMLCGHGTFRPEGAVEFRSSVPI